MSASHLLWISQSHVFLVYVFGKVVNHDMVCMCYRLGLCNDIDFNNIVHSTFTCNFQSLKATPTKKNKIPWWPLREQYIWLHNRHPNMQRVFTCNSFQPTLYKHIFYPDILIGYGWPILFAFAYFLKLIYSHGGHEGYVNLKYYTLFILGYMKNLFISKRGYVPKIIGE